MPSVHALETINNDVGWGGDGANTRVEIQETVIVVVVVVYFL